MGLFDRIAALARGREVPRDAPAPAPAGDPLRLIEAGHRAEEQGGFKQALDLYDQAVALAPSLAKAHLNRGNALLALGDAAAAAEAYQTALKHEPDSAAAHFNLGHACAGARQPEAAFAAYRRALELQPDFADAEVAMGVLHEDQGQPDEAAERYRRALRLQPDAAPVHGNLAAVLLRQGRLEEAVASYRRALALEPRLTPLQAGLGDALFGLQQHEAAAASYRRFLQDHPDVAPAHGQLGLALRALGRRDEALASLRRAAALAGDSALAHFALGSALAEFGQEAEALAALRRATQLDPNHADAQGLLGNLLADRGQLDEALACYERILQAEPTHVLALNNRGGVLRRLGRMAEAAASYERAIEIDPDLVAARSNLLFIRNSLAQRPSTALLAEARRFGEVAARKARPFTHWDNAPEPERPLRIGLVSGDLRSHPVGYFLVGVLASLVSQAGERLALHAYANQTAFDDVSARIKASCRAWNAVSALDDEALAGQVRADGIDILIDLAGHTGHTRVQAFAWKPAPVQATWLGYLATTGVDAIDHLVADAWTLPPDEEPFFTERVWRLPETYLCFTPPAEAGSEAPVGPLPAMANGHVTFGSFNNLTKMTGDVVALWARVLQAVPGSRLLLKAQQLQDAAMRRQVAAQFAGQGIAPERLLLEGLVARADYLKPFARVDIALDPCPYPGITTTVENLWMGVPVLTLAGHTFLSRQGVGLLSNAGLPDWIASDPDDYVERAVRHAGDLPSLQRLRERLRAQVQASPLFDAPRFARHFEEALRGMWRRWCERPPPGLRQPAPAGAASGLAALASKRRQRRARAGFSQGKRGGDTGARPRGPCCTW